MQKYRHLTTLPLLFVALLSGCASLKGPEVDIHDAAALVAYMDSEGLSMLDLGPTTNQWMSAPGHEFTVTTGGTLQVYEYSSGAGALLDVTLIDGDKDIFRAPHVYYRDNLVVIYNGNDPKVEEVLTYALGARVA